MGHIFAIRIHCDQNVRIGYRPSQFSETVGDRPLMAQIEGNGDHGRVGSFNVVDARVRSSGIIHRHEPETDVAVLESGERGNGFSKF